MDCVTIAFLMDGWIKKDVKVCTRKASIVLWKSRNYKTGDVFSIVFGTVSQNFPIPHCTLGLHHNPHPNNSSIQTALSREEHILRPKQQNKLSVSHFPTDSLESLKEKQLPAAFSDQQGEVCFSFLLQLHPLEKLLS